jgi:hypothetical protein
MMTLDNKSNSLQKKPTKAVLGSAQLKSGKFSGMKTAILNQVKDLDYAMAKVNHKASLQMNPDQIHNYSVNYKNHKFSTKRPLMLTSQKSAKRRSVDRENSKSKNKRSQSDNHRMLSSKRKKKEHTKSPSIDSAYYNKMVASIGNNSKYQNKTLRKVVKQNGKILSKNAAILAKKGSKDTKSKKISNYYQHNNSKSNDQRQKSTNIRSLPLSLVNSFEKKSKEKNTTRKKKENSLKNYKKVSNHVFYHKGKVSVSGQHLKFSKPKSKSNISHHSENPAHNFSNNLAFSAMSTPISPPFYQDMNSKTLFKGKKGESIPYKLLPQNYKSGDNSGMSYDNMGLKFPYPSFFKRPETNVNVYEEDMAFLSSGDHTKNQSFYKDISNSFNSQTYDNPGKNNAKRDMVNGYSYHQDHPSKKRIIMDKKTKMSKISEIMGHKDITKKPKKHKRQSKTGFQSKISN